MDKLNFDLNTLEETLERWFLQMKFHNSLRENPPETVQVADSLGRVTARPVFAVHPSPSFYAASVDGIAVLSSKTFGVSPHNPLKLKIGKNAHFVDTGSIMPEGTDAVVPIEKVKFQSIEEVVITNFLAPWENVRPLGEEVAAKEVILPAHHKIRPLDVAAMCMGSVTKLEVTAKPKVGIIPIGTGLLQVGSKPRAGKMIETSSQIISKEVVKLGGEPIVHEIIPEKVEDLIKAFSEMVSQTDMILAIAGPKMGTRPIAWILQQRGELITYGVLVKPGMSSCFGIIRGVPVIGLPGYAMSTFIIFKLFGHPVIFRKLGIKQPPRKTIRAYLSRNINSPDGVDEFIRVSLAEVDNLPVAAPLSRGAHVLMSLVRADGMVRVKPDQTDVRAGEVVEVETLREFPHTRKKVLISGTHDLSFDLMRNELQKKYSDVSMFTDNVGSMRGLMALKAGYCHIASIHLFDDETGEFNIPFVRKFLFDIPLLVVNIFFRRLGFIVAKGNPLNITGFEDLIRDDVRVINRIRGSGTRTVFDYYLKKHNIDLNRVTGYAKEAHNHLNLAAAVASKNADVGLGILEAAKATGLDFIPLIPEKLDFVVPRKFLKDYPVRCILKIISSGKFKEEVEALGGYDVSHTGKIVYEQ